MDDEQFDLYEGLENFEDSAQSEPEVEEKEEKVVISDDEDDFNLVVDDEDSLPQQQEVKPVKKTKKSIYTRKYRIFFVGAPGETPGSTISNIEFFVLVKNLPIWIDDGGLMEYVKNITSGVAYTKVLYNQYDGTPLGIGLVEFSEISACTTFLKHKSHIASMPMPLQVYTHISSDYRHGIVSESLIKSACKILSVQYKSTSSFCTSQQDMIELEYERQQEELVKNGEYEIVTKTFPWFSYDLVSIMGTCNRMMAPKPQSRSRRSKRGPGTGKSAAPFNQFAVSSGSRAFHGGSSGKGPGTGANSRSSSASTSSVHLESYLSSNSMEGMGDKLGFLSTMLQSSAEGKAESLGAARESTSRADASVKHESSSKRDVSRHESGSKHGSSRSPDRQGATLTVRKSSDKPGPDRDHKSSSNRDKGVKAREKSRKRNFEQMRSDRSLERQDAHKSRRERSPDRRDRGRKRDKARHDKGVHRNPDKRR